jgi:hypothetical protein
MGIYGSPDEKRFPQKSKRLCTHFTICWIIAASRDAVDPWETIVVKISREVGGLLL